MLRPVCLAVVVVCQDVICVTEFCMYVTSRSVCQFAMSVLQIVVSVSNSGLCVRLLLGCQTLVNMLGYSISV